MLTSSRLRRIAMDCAFAAQGKTQKQSKGTAINRHAPARRIRLQGAPLRSHLTMRQCLRADALALSGLPGRIRLKSPCFLCVEMGRVYRGGFVKNGASEARQAVGGIRKGPCWKGVDNVFMLSIPFQWGCGSTWLPSCQEAFDWRTIKWILSTQH
jgi:hypothetical protein